MRYLGSCTTHILLSQGISKATQCGHLAGRLQSEKSA